MLLLAATQVSPVEVALIGACGALIGGLLTAGTNLLMDARRASREEAVERRAVARELRRAARLVAEDLADAAQALEAAIGAEHYPPEALHLHGPAWENGRAVLAAELSEAPWSDTSAAYDQLRRVERLAGERSRRGPSGRPVAVLPEDDLLAARDAVRTGLAAMRETAS